MSTERQPGGLSTAGRYGNDGPPEWITEALRDATARDGDGPEPGIRTGDVFPRRRRSRVPLALAAVALVGAGYGAAQVIERPSGSVTGARGSGVPGPIRSGEPVSAVAEALLPSVVQIETSQGLGSGVIYDSDGLIVTAAHVIGDAADVTIRFADGSRVAGDVVGRDAGTDVAVVRVARDNLPAAPLALGDPVRVGQLAVAIGSPFGLEGSVTSGVVSAIDRAVPIDGGDSVTSMIQTDAPINPGNSGGALADRTGRVIGINDAIRTSSGTNSGVGFAIPIETAYSVADALVEGRTPRVGFLGINGTDPQSGHAGALVAQVGPGTPAAAAGLQRGDVITAIDGRAIEDMAALVSRIRLIRPGTTVTLEVLRNGRTLQLDARIGAQ